MLSKCANPNCSTTLLYLREGKVFKVESDVSNVVTTDRKQVRRVEHFWLCGPCAEFWTLAYDPERGMRVEAKQPLVRRAAAS
jgi:hypothetical protein